ncbi:MAG TPA: GNAT family N-acetyltransferase [Planctomycetaceae bacterium]|nr:GNAT family N-acetyltransferase [Planctomycetaceae bacterium]
MLNTTVLPAADLTPDHLASWTKLQTSQPELASPYFRPEFTLAVAAVRHDVEVAVLSRHAEMAGFFPYQRRRRTAQPVAGRLSDSHGLIARPDLDCTADDLLRACGLSSWAFHHLPASQSWFASHASQTEGSPYLDLSRGFDAYRQELHAAGREGVSQPLRKRRKFDRECGPLRFELDCRDPAMLERLLAWKSTQYRRTGLTDVFAFGWTVSLVKRIWEHRGMEFCGLLSVLYAGDRPAAAHFGMRSHGILHYWFPAYDVDLARFSPGSILLVQIAQAAEAAGIRRIELGRGSKPAKTSVMSGATLVAEGRVERRPLVRWVRGHWGRARQSFRSSALRRRLESPLRLVRPLREWFAFR